MMRRSWKLIGWLILGLFVWPNISYGTDVNSTVKALRIANSITGGTMPVSDPIFAQMVEKIQAGDARGAAQLVVQSKYFAGYLGRRLALQMQSPSLDAENGSDSDATAFIMAHFLGAAGLNPSISTLWSENATYLVNITTNGTAAQTRAAALTNAQLLGVDWSRDLVRTEGQNAKARAANNAAAAAIAIPAKHVGGYTTLSDRINDNSFAMYGASAGTNLRMIEGIWQIATGLSLSDTQSTDARAQDVPRFVPQYDSNFFQGQGQAACLSCHGGGMSSLHNGYAAVADVFDFDPKNGFTFIDAPTTATMKSLGSDANQRTRNATCNLTQKPTPVCNPDSPGVDANQGWDLSITWGPSGVLDLMGWRAGTMGQGLNALGVALGQSKIVYTFMTKRVIGEICPMGIFSPEEVAVIAAQADPFATPKGTDDIRTIIALVASHATCL
jgi:hypothetical protein